MTSYFKTSPTILEIPYFKLVIIGPKEVGKSQIIKKFIAEEEFDSNYYPTYLIDFHIKKLYDDFTKETNEIQIIEIAGNNFIIQIDTDENEEKYKEKDEKIIMEVFKDAEAVIIVYDLSKDSSFFEAEEILKAILYNSKIENLNEKIWCITGNKKDLVVNGGKSNEWEKIKRIRDIVKGGDGGNFNYFEVSASEEEGYISEMMSQIIVKIKNLKESNSKKKKSNEEQQPKSTEIKEPKWNLSDDCLIL